MRIIELRVRVAFTDTNAESGDVVAEMLTSALLDDHCAEVSIVDVVSEATVGIPDFDELDDAGLDDGVIEAWQAKARAAMGVKD